MIIGVDGSRAFSDKRTGTENYSYQLLKHLGQIDQKNTYYIYLRPNSVIPSTFPSNFKFITLSYPRLWTQLGLAKQTFIDKLDLLFIPAHTLPLTRKPGLKTIVTVHDLGAEYLPKTHQLKQRLYLSLMTNYQLKTATKLIAVSKATKEDLVKKVGIDPKNISVIYEGYDKEKFKSQNSKVKIDQTIKKYNLKYQKYFLFVGTIQPRKNLARLIRAYARLLTSNRGPAGPSVLSSGSKDPQPHPTSSVVTTSLRALDGAPRLPSPLPTDLVPKLVLAGGKGWLSEEIYQLPKKLGIEDKVKFLGYVSDENLPALYCGAQAFVFPSLFEGFGLPVLEAMACGCPVLTSKTSSLPEVAGKAAILVDPYCEKEITQALTVLTTNNQQRTNLVNLGKTQIKKFSWEKCAKETLDLFESMK